MAYEEWVKRYMSIFWALHPDASLSEESVLRRLEAEYPDDPELAAWDSRQPISGVIGHSLIQSKLSGSQS